MALLGAALSLAAAPAAPEPVPASSVRPVVVRSAGFASPPKALLPPG
ncbi:MAG: hypothetical protein RJA37_1592, partial [Verrucomicrobiota bacterium]